MKIYAEAYRADCTPILGNLDGQTVWIDQADYRRTARYKMLCNGEVRCSRKVHHWKIVTEHGKLLQTIANVKYSEEG